MKKIFSAFFILISIKAFSQGTLPVNCDIPVAGCSTPSFDIVGVNPGNNIEDFGTGTGSNPSTNPNVVPGNSGCLLSGETVSTFITINIVTDGTLEWSLQGSGGGFFDWIMWPFVYPPIGQTSPTCAMLQDGSLAPIACNWNMASAGFTGMAAPGNLPAGADQGNFEYALNVTAGQSFLLCLSNYSGTNQSVNLDFFGTCDVLCGVSAIDQTICNGSSATVDISTPGLVSPVFNWLVTTGVSDPNAGTGVVVTPSVTTTYLVEVIQYASGGGIDFIDTAEFTIFVVDPPITDAGPDQNTCFGFPITLNGSVGDPANTVLWQYNTSVIPTPVVTFSPSSSTEDPTVNVDQTGVYNFVLNESNSVCPPSTDTVIVTVTDLSIAASFVNPTCEGYSNGEIHIASDNAIAYSFDNGVTWQVDSFAVNFAEGTYDVCVKNAFGCLKCTEVTLTDPVKVIVDVRQDTIICQNGSADLLAWATGGNSFLYYWSFTNDHGDQHIVSPSTSTVYDVYAENENGCVSESKSVIVDVLPVLTGTISANDTICPGYPTDIMADVSGGFGEPYTFIWSSGDTFVGESKDTINVNPLFTTNYTVTVTDQCESTPLVMTTNIRVAPVPVPLFEVLNPEQCEPAVFDIVNKTDSAMCATWDWYIDNKEYHIENGDTISTVPMEAGNYNVQLVVTSFEGCIDSLTTDFALTSWPKPVAQFNFNPNPVRMFNTTVHFANNTVNGETYQWYFEDGIPSTSTENDVIVKFPDGVVGQYDVILVATSVNGCVDTARYELIVSPEILIYAPNAFTPDDDEFNQDWRVYMEGVDVFQYQIKIYNRWGEVIWVSYDLEQPWDGTYNGNPVPSGTYVWHIETKDRLNDSKYTYNGHINLLR